MRTQNAVPPAVLGPQGHRIYFAHESRYGHTISTAPSREQIRRKAPMGTTRNWPDIQASMLWVNRRLEHLLAYAWKHILNAGERTAWDAAASGNTWMGYDGTVVTPNGFQLFMAAQRFWKTYPFLPTMQYGNILKPPQIHGEYTTTDINKNPPNLATTPPQPTFATIQYQGDGYVYFETNNDPNPNQYTMLFAIATDFSPPVLRTPKHYIVSYGNYPDFIFPSVSGHAFIDYPGPYASAKFATLLAMRYFDANTMVFGDPIWVQIYA